MGRSWRILSRCCICLYPMCLLGPVISVLSISWYTIEKKTKQNKTKQNKGTSFISVLGIRQEKGKFMALTHRHCI